MAWLAAVDDGIIDVRSILIKLIIAGNGDGFAFEIDVFVVSTSGVQHHVAFHGSIDARLDVGLILPHADDVC